MHLFGQILTLYDQREFQNKGIKHIHALNLCSRCLGNELNGEQKDS